MTMRTCNMPYEFRVASDEINLLGISIITLQGFCLNMEI